MAILTNRHCNPLCAIGLAMLLAGCAGGPKYPIDNKTQPSAKEVSLNATTVLPQKVVWGGMIANAENQENVTRLEVVSYPLDYEQRPNTNKAAQGRFIVEKSGYLETTDYSPQRLITVKGSVDERVNGKIGDAAYDFPLVRSDEIYLWAPPRNRRERDSRFQFGIGVILSN